MSGGGKETPRQKMIGMMYLVLTAMLALNVSAEVLNAFGLFETGLSQTARVFSEKNDATENVFRAANAENKERIGPWLTKSLDVREKSKQLIAYIESLKIEMVTLADGVNPLAVENGKVIGERIVNVSTTEPSSNLMVRQQKGLELKNKLREYQAYLLSMLKPEAAALINNIEKLLETKNIHSAHGGGVEKPWEIGTFTDLPVIAAVPLLTKMQVNILTCEADMMSYLLSQADAGTVKIDNFDPVVQSVSDYVIRGGKFEAQIFLAASDRTLQPSVVVNGQSLHTIEGKAHYEAQANSVGEQSIKGVITLNSKSYPFTYTYTVAEPSVVVSPSKMNVLYRGVLNPIDVSAAGIPDSKVRISVSNGVLSRENQQYMINPGDGVACDVSVVAEINGEMRNMGKKIFRVKSVPKPVPEMDGIQGRTATRQQMVSSQGIRAIMPQDFDFDMKFSIKSFVVFAPIDGYVMEETAYSQMFTEKQKKIMARLQIGQRLSITEIKAVGPDGKTVDLQDLSIKVR
ncbi:MAG: gliding motility protein GldM [Prevotellaceae bacterium]|jgi:gliding motility-associated protein GldM|nr:gliding motility protein GldM [Prevotellaceae bacterium]